MMQTFIFEAYANPVWLKYKKNIQMYDPSAGGEGTVICISVKIK